MHSYQHNIKTFNNATRHLTRVERSLYRDLIELYYDSEQPLPADNFERLCRLVIANTDEEKEALNYVLGEFFEKTGDVYSHDYCDEQIDKYKSAQSAKAAAGKASAEARRKKSEARKEARKSKNEQPLNTCSTDREQNPTNQKPLTSNQEPLTNINNYFEAWPETEDGKLFEKWLEVRTKAGGVNSQTAFDRLRKQFVTAIKNGYTFEQCLTAAIGNEWKGFKAEWMDKPGDTEKPETLISADWQPSRDSCELLQGNGLDENFILDLIPEFVLYWRERGSASRNWDGVFRKHALHRREQAENKPNPHVRIGTDWSPSQETFDSLQDAGVEINYIESLVSNFVIYWAERGEARNDWNSKFSQYALKNWANRSANQGKTASLTIADQLTDRSWAQGL